MSLFADFQSVVVEAFKGPWQLLEPSDIPIDHAILAQNVEYLPGLVKSRTGYGSAITVGHGVASCRDWITLGFNGPENWLAYLDVTGEVRKINLADSTTIDLFAAAGSPVGAAFVPAGPRLYIATFDINGLGTDEGHVSSNFSAFTGLYTEVLFAPPIQAVPAVADLGVAGNVTAGLHRVGYLITTYNGFTTSPSPIDSNGNFAYATWTAAGAQQAIFTLTATFPSYAQGIQVIMTTTTELDTWFIVPGTQVAVPGGSTFTVSTLIDISDDDLAATATSAANFFNLLTEINGGPIKPSYILEYNNRMVYVARDKVGVPSVYVSDEDAYQSLTPDQHVIYIPGSRLVTSAFTLYRTLYMLGPHWTYGSQDNGDVPVQWAPPALVDGSIGTLSPLGVAVNASRGFAWIADTDGLYLFSGGAYASRPVSYYQRADWQRINWAKAGVVQVVDNKETKKVHVIAPLDSAVNPSHILTWDYTQGTTPETVNYSLDNIQSFSLGAIAVVQNDTNKRLETWVASRDSGTPALRQRLTTESTPYSDNGHAIQAVYQTSLLPDTTAAVLQHHGDQFRLQGSGNTLVSASTLDGGRVFSLTAVLEATSPAKWFMRRYHALSEGMTLTFSTSGDGDWFQLSGLNHFYSPYMLHR